MNAYLVYDDRTGAFVDIADVQNVTSYRDGSLIHLKSNGKTIESPLKPREVLRRIAIIRYKQEQPKDGRPPVDVSTQGGSVVSGQSNPTSKMD